MSDHEPSTGYIHYVRGRPSLASRGLTGLLRTARFFRPPVKQDIAEWALLMRKQADSMLRFAPKPPESVSVDTLELGGTRGYRIRSPHSRPDKALFYVQGGGFIMGSATSSHRDMVWRLAQCSATTAYAIDYGLAPEHTFDTGCRQVIAAYRQLVDQYGAKNIIVGGDSAGGLLSLAMLQQLKSARLEAPAALFLLSPKADFTGSGDSATENHYSDHVIPSEAVQLIGDLYAGHADLSDPLYSPVFGNFDDFPPTLIQVGEDEIFLDDARRCAAALNLAGAQVRLEIWANVPHVWHGFAKILPEAEKAIAAVGKFIKPHLN